MMETTGLFLFAGVVGGIVNAMAGGAKLFVFPMLLASGLPPLVANATGTVAVWPAQLPAAWVYRQDLLDDRRGLFRRMLPALIGALCGALALIFSTEKAFLAVIPFLLLIAVGAIIAGPRLTDWLANLIPAGQTLFVTRALLFGSGFYGGYFGAGMGFMLLAVLTIAGARDIQHANANKLIFSLSINTTAVVPLALSGLVNWLAAISVLIGGLIGGYAGAHFSRRLPAGLMRLLVGLLGLVLTFSYLFREL